MTATAPDILVAVASVERLRLHYSANCALQRTSRARHRVVGTAIVLATSRRRPAGNHHADRLFVHVFQRRSVPRGPGPSPAYAWMGTRARGRRRRRRRPPDIDGAPDSVGPDARQLPLQPSRRAFPACYSLRGASFGAFQRSRHDGDVARHHRRRRLLAGRRAISTGLAFDFADSRRRNGRSLGQSWWAEARARRTRRRSLVRPDSRGQVPVVAMSVVPGGIAFG